MSEERLGFSEADWATLKQGPLYMLGLVGAADAHIDTKEWMALIDAVLASANADDELVKGVMGALSHDLHAGHEEIPGHSSPVDGLRRVRFLLETHREDGGRSFREALLQIGAAIAESSGAQMTRTFAAHHGQAGWTRSAGTSAAERTAMAAAAEVLNLAGS